MKITKNEMINLIGDFREWNNQWDEYDRGSRHYKPTNIERFATELLGKYNDA